MSDHHVSKQMACSSNGKKQVATTVFLSSLLGYGRSSRLGLAKTRTPAIIVSCYSFPLLPPIVTRTHATTYTTTTTTTTSVSSLFLVLVLVLFLFLFLFPSLFILQSFDFLLEELARRIFDPDPKISEDFLEFQIASRDRFASARARHLAS